jgi:hypothetical protein
MDKAHVHVWEPIVAWGVPARLCSTCDEWEQISRKKFKKMFGYLLWQKCKRQMTTQREAANGILAVSEVPN